MKSLFLLPLLCCLLSSCAIVSKKDCADLDWAAKAQQDIQTNKDWQKYLEKYDKVCSKHGFSITKDYMKGVHTKGGKICTRYNSFPEESWFGLGSRDALGAFRPDHSKYQAPCSQYKISVDADQYNEGVKSVGGRACAAYSDFEDRRWEGVGVRDAMMGKTPTVDSYLELCKQHYFTEVNTKDFFIGYKKGLKDFCTKASGYEFGLKGGLYNKTCKRGERSFLKAYAVGRDVRTANHLEANYKAALSRVANITQSIAKKHSEIESLNGDVEDALKRYRSEKEDLDDDIESKTSELGRENDPERQDAIRLELTDLREDAVDLEEEILRKETSLKREIEETRFSISRLREERRGLDRSIPRLETKFRAARAKADRSLTTL